MYVPQRNQIANEESVEKIVRKRSMDGEPAFLSCTTLTGGSDADASRRVVPHPVSFRFHPPSLPLALPILPSARLGRARKRVVDRRGCSTVNALTRTSLGLPCIDTVSLCF